MSSSSKIESQLKQISYLTCQLDGHDTEPLSRICIDKECNHKTLICSICEQEKHKGHETTPLKSFLIKFYAAQKEKKSTQFSNPLYFASKIDQLKNSFFSTINQFKTELNETLNDLEAKARIYFNQMSQKLLLLIQFQNPIDVIKNEGISQYKMKKYIEQILDNFKIKEKFSLSQKLSALLSKGQEKQKQLTTTLGKIKNQAFGFLNKIEKSLDPESLNTIQKIVFTWSEELKGTKMKINGPVAEQTGMQSSGQRFIMLQPSITDGVSDNKVRWGIKVLKFVGWIGVGMCLKNVISKANFFFNYTTIGHGSYMISNNGYSWSHSATEFNSAHKTFHYGPNDIIYLEYDRIAKKLRFRKNQNGQKFELDIVDPPLGDSYHPCANICSTGDTIEVINPGIELS